MSWSSVVVLPPPSVFTALAYHDNATITAEQKFYSTNPWRFHPLPRLSNYFSHLKLFLLADNKITHHLQ
jgi:hypothetical protein